MTSHATATRDCALIVGTARYERDEYLPLKGPPNDCKEFGKWLIEDAGLMPEDVHSAVWNQQVKWPNPDFSEVSAALSRLLRRDTEDDAPGGRRLYLYSAGHCESEDELSANIVTADSRQPTCLAFPVIRAATHIRNAGLFEEIVAFVDGCRTVNFDSGIPIKLDLPAMASAVRDTRVLYAFACQYGFEAYERRFGKVYGGIFSRALLEGLRGGARTRAGRITSERLTRFLRRRVAELRRPHQLQEPHVFCPRPIVLLDDRT
jgi:hypothetical protein